MVESATIMQPFSFQEIANESQKIPSNQDEDLLMYKSNPLLCLQQSVSFGRFETETLDWEKWSVFTHKKYVEEAERHSRRGLVAEQKAFFEEYYKKLASAKEAASLQSSQSDSVRGSDKAGNVEKEEKVLVQMQNSKRIDAVDNKIGVVDGNEVEVMSPKIPEKENQVTVDLPKKMGLLQELQLRIQTQGEKPVLKSYTLEEDPLSKSIKISAIAPSHPSSDHQDLDLSTSPENSKNLISKNVAVDLEDENEVTPISTNESHDIAVVEETNIISSPITQKIDDTRTGTDSDASKECSVSLRIQETIKEDDTRSGANWDASKECSIPLQIQEAVKEDDTRSNANSDASKECSISLQIQETVKEDDTRTGTNSDASKECSVSLQFKETVKEDDSRAGSYTDTLMTPQIQVKNSLSLLATHSSSNNVSEKRRKKSFSIFACFCFGPTEASSKKQDHKDEFIISSKPLKQQPLQSLRKKQKRNSRKCAGVCDSRSETCLMA